MSEIEHGGNTYRIGKLNAFQQLHVSRRLGPVLLTAIPMFIGRSLPDVIKEYLTSQGVGLMDMAGPVVHAFAQMKDEDVDYIVSTCLGVVARQDGKGWSAVMRSGNMMFDDIDMIDLMALTCNVINGSLADITPTFLSRS